MMLQSSMSTFSDSKKVLDTGILSNPERAEEMTPFPAHQPGSWTLKQAIDDVKLER